MTALGMLHVSWRPYRFCPECGAPVGRNSRKGTLGCHAGKSRHELCDGRLVAFKSLPMPTCEQWVNYWMSAERRWRRLVTP
jgi:hypothetical protein